MPNWCENCLRIYADDETRQKILSECVSLDEYRKPRLDFEKLIPVGDAEDWYGQRIEKWGTKWNSADCVIDEGYEDPLEIDLMTAWSPPVPIISAIAGKYRCYVRLEYYEAGMAFRGEASAAWKDGEVVLEDKSWDMAESDFKELGLL